MSKTSATADQQREPASDHSNRHSSVPRHLFEATFRSQRDGILVLDDQDSPHILNGNPAALRMFGYSENELIGLAVDRLFDDAAQSPFSLGHSHTIAEYGFCDLSDCAMRRSDGSRFPTEYSLTPLHDASNKHTGWILVVRDITTRKHQESMLRESENRFRMLTEFSPDAILVHQDGNIVFCNEAAWRMLGGSRAQDIVGRTVKEFIDTSDETTLQSIVRHLSQRADSDSRLEQRLITLDGSSVTAEVASRPTRYFDKPAVQIVMRDVSQRKEMESKLRRTTSELERERELLTSKNTALKEVINQVDQEKHHLRSQVQSNVERVINPILRSLRVHVGDSGEAYLNMLEEHLKELVSPFIRRLDQMADRLSPRETEVCTLISQGMTSKEIADTLGISEHTVLKLRQRIRRKLNLTNEDVNLVSYLQNLRHDN